MWLLVSALLLALLGFVLLAYSRNHRLAAGLPEGRVVYADTAAWKHGEQVLFSARYALSGKPDYLVEERGHIVPVEVKPGRQGVIPYEGDILQLAAYCLLVEETHGRRPRYGYLKYQRALFRIDYTADLRRRLLSELADMRSDLHARDVAPNHSDSRRCLNCGHRPHCAKRLA